MTLSLTFRGFGPVETAFPLFGGLPKSADEDGVDTNLMAAPQT